MKRNEELRGSWREMKSCEVLSALHVIRRVKKEYGNVWYFSVGFSPNLNFVTNLSDLFIVRHTILEQWNFGSCWVAVGSVSFLAFVFWFFVSVIFVFNHLMSVKAFLVSELPVLVCKFQLNNVLFFFFFCNNNVLF